jgi:hypothetical protein
MSKFTRTVAGITAIAYLGVCVPVWAQQPGEPSGIQTQPAQVEPQPDEQSNAKKPGAPLPDSGGAAGAGAEGISMNSTTWEIIGGVILLGGVIALAAGGGGGGSPSTH